MAQPVVYQTLSNLGVDPTVYYTNVSTPGGSVSPELPAPPFIAGQRAFGTDGSEFVFVQASTSISLGDFVTITQGNTSTPYQANSMTSTNIAGSAVVGVGATGLVLKQSVTNIPAQAYFWACTRGSWIPAQTSNGLATNATSVVLWTSATAGVVTSVTTSSSLAQGLAGIICVNSLTVSIPASVVPPVGTLTTTGFAQGPIVAINNLRTVVMFSSTNGSMGGTFIGGF